MFEDVVRLESVPVGVCTDSICVTGAQLNISSVSVSSVSNSVSVSVVPRLISPGKGFFGVTGRSFVRLTEGRMGIRLAIALGFP